MAAERNYRARPLQPALAAFAEARRNNLETFRSLDDGAWLRGGTQEAVGEVSLCDIPSLMAQHDAAHRREIDDWNRARG